MFTRILCLMFGEVPEHRSAVCNKIYVMVDTGDSVLLDRWKSAKLNVRCVRYFLFNIATVEIRNSCERILLVTFVTSCTCKGSLIKMIAE